MKKQKIKNIDKAANKIKKAIKDGERIILYGDSDMDGVTSTVILEEAIKNLGGHIDCVMFPDRESDGYGLNLKALRKIDGKHPALMILMDQGIGNIKEIDLANKMGFEVIIIDHHEPLKGLPEASVIVDPKQKSDSYPFKGLANVGIVFNLCLELLGDSKKHLISQNLKNSFLELAALGTIADRVPQIEQNQDIIEEGLRSLRNTFRPALRAFLDILGDGKVFEEYLSQIIAALNSAESVDFNNDSYTLLTSSDQQKCRELAQKLLDKNKHKQTVVNNIVKEIERRIQKEELKGKSQNIIFEGDPSWKLVLAGSAASIICEKYQKPAFIFKKMDNESCGSVRNPLGTNSVEAMKECSDILITYGGHANASGFRIKNEHLDEFKECLNKYFKK